MREGLSLVLAVALAGCADDRGVDLQVTSSEPVDRVELFLIAQSCVADDGGACAEGISWGPASVRGEIFLQSADEKVISTTELVGDTATMHLQIEQGFAQPIGMVVVGYRGAAIVASATLWDTTIPSNHAETWRVKLQPTTDGATVDPVAAPHSGEQDVRAQVWARRPVDQGYAGCLVYQQWDSSELKWKTKFVVPAEDPDCDGQAVECNAYWMDYNVGTDRPNACVLPNSNVGDACMIGVAQCEDGVTTSTECRLPTTASICVPDLVCDQCKDDPALASCAANLFRSVVPGSPMFMAGCTYHPNATGSGPCINSQAGRASILLPLGCGTAVAHDLSTPLVGGSTTITIGGLTFSVVTTNATNKCLVDLYWQSGVVTDPAVTKVDMALDVPYGNFHVVVPVRIEFEAALVCDTYTQTNLCVLSNTADKILGCTP